jgi:phytanoyl-CoA hydroxylase
VTREAVSTHDDCQLPAGVPDEQIRFFVEQGYLVLDNVVSESELAELKQDAVDLARGKYPSKTLQPLNAEMTDDEVLSSILCIHQPHYVSPVIGKYVKHAQVCSILSQITAAHLPFWDGAVKCMQSMLFVKPPGYPGQAWHQDEIYIPTRDRSLVGAWIAIDDATIDNGCLWVIPGSHKNGYLYPQQEHSHPGEFDFAPESYGFDDSAEVPVEVKAGSVVFFNGYLLHRSRKNRSDIYRRVLVSHYMNAWSLLPWQLAEGEDAAGGDYRCVVPVAGQDPYAWKGYTEPDGQVWLRTCEPEEKS